MPLKSLLLWQSLFCFTTSLGCLWRLCVNYVKNSQNTHLEIIHECTFPTSSRRPLCRPLRLCRIQNQLKDKLNIMGYSGGQINMYLPPGYPIIAIWNERNQNGHRICKTVYARSTHHRCVQSQSRPWVLVALTSNQEKERLRSNPKRAKFDRQLKNRFSSKHLILFVFS